MYFFVLVTVLLKVTMSQVSLEYPNSAIQVLTSAMRLDIDNYKRLYSKTQQGCSFPAAGQLGPLYVDDQLSQASIAHSQDQAKHSTMSHNTLDQQLQQDYGGSGFSSRIRRFYSGPANIAENVGEGESFTAPQKLVDAWLEHDSHCENIKGPYDRIGAGLGYNSNDQYKVYATQDFALVSAPANVAFAAASHLVLVGSNLLSLLAVTANSAIARVQVVFGNQRIDLKQQFGNNKGMGALFAANVDVQGAGCAQYYFEAFDQSNNLIESYPRDVSMQTGGFNQCPVGAPTVRGHSNPSAQAVNQGQQLTKSFTPTTQFQQAPVPAPAPSPPPKTVFQSTSPPKTVFQSTSPPKSQPAPSTIASSASSVGASPASAPSNKKTTAEVANTLYKMANKYLDGKLAAKKASQVAQTGKSAPGNSIITAPTAATSGDAPTAYGNAPASKLEPAQALDSKFVNPTINWSEANTTKTAIGDAPTAAYESDINQQFTSQSVKSSPPTSTIAAVVVSIGVVVAAVIAMAFYVQRNVSSGEKWNSPKLAHASLSRTLGRQPSAVGLRAQEEGQASPTRM